MKKIKDRANKNKMVEVSSPKGMRDLMNEEYYSFQGFLSEKKCIR